MPLREAEGGVNRRGGAHRGDIDGGDGEEPAGAAGRPEDEAGEEESGRVGDLSRHHRARTLPQRREALDPSADGVDDADERIESNGETHRREDPFRHVLIDPEVPAADRRRREKERHHAETESRADRVDEEPPVALAFGRELDRDRLHPEGRVGDGVRDPERDVVDRQHVLRVRRAADEGGDDERGEHEEEAAERKREREMELLPGEVEMLLLWWWWL